MEAAERASAMKSKNWGIPLAEPKTGLQRDDPGTLDAATFGHLYRAIETWGLDRACDVLAAGAWVISPAAAKGMDPDDLPNEDYQENVARIRRVLEAVQATVEDWRASGIRAEDMVLQITYALLRMKAITHAEAAELASSFLKKRVSPNAWRMRINRWTEAHGYPKVELYTRHGSETHIQH